MLKAAIFLPLAFAAIIPPPLDSRAISVVSPNKTCGLVIGGNNQGWTCPGDAACCSQYGYCGSTDEFCLTTAGCQSRYSNATNACQAPRSGVSISPDGTCGSTGVGKNGYRCPGTGTTCCSARYFFFLFFFLSLSLPSALSF